MKKFRGKKRYFRNLWREVNNVNLKLDDEYWFDLWHTHLDFWGRGKLGSKIRKEHITAHLALYNNILNQLEHFKKPYQTWVSISENEPCMDAVFIHSVNPNNDNFPLEISNLKRNCTLPDRFKNLIDVDKFDIAYDENDCTYIIQSKKQGIKL